MGVITRVGVPAVLVALMLLSGIAAADTVELLSGAKVTGEITARDQRSITFNTVIGSRTYTRNYPIEKIHAVVIDGNREMLNAKSEADPTPSAGNGRTQADIEALINKVGRATPEWWDSVSLACPRTLDLSWPMPPPKGWNNQKNVGQYVWDVVNPNPSKWHEGVRLMHHLLVVNQAKPETRRRVMNRLGRMYHDLLQDYPRAAFWWRQAGVDRGSQASLAGVHLAECYWKLGNKRMALDLLTKIPPHFAMIKLWADMGETDRAIAMAEANTRGAYADIAYIYAGDACRVAGQYQQALQYYQKLLAMPLSGPGWKRVQRNQQRARANVEGIRLFDMLDPSRVPDGTYQASSLGFKGQVHVAVSVAGGRIEQVRVTQHQEKQFYSALTDTPRKIIQKQGVKGVDATSSATITSEAIINATAKALARAMK